MQDLTPRLLATPLVLALVLVLSGAVAAGGSAKDGIPRLDFGYDASAPLGYADHGRTGAVHDVSFRSQGRTIQGYLVVPAGSGRHAAVVLVHGQGGDRREQLAHAKELAARNVVALTITEPSTSGAPIPSSDPATYLAQVRDVQVRDVVAVRRAVDVLRSLPSVDPKRIGYLGWSAGGRTGTFVAAAEPRVKALALLSTGAAPLSAFVAQAPAGFRGQVRQVLGSVDPLRYVAFARPGTLLLEDGRKDEVVPRPALVGIANAAPKGTTVRWYDAAHALTPAAWADALGWLSRKLAGS